MKKTIKVVVLSNIDWGFLKQRHHYVASAFLKNKQVECVYFIESTGKRLPSLNDIPRIYKRLFRPSLIKKMKNKKNSSLKVISPITLPSTNRLFNFINKHILIKNIIDKVNIENNKYKYVFIIYLPSQTTMSIVDKFKNKLVLYDCVTNYSSLESNSPGITISENQIIKNCDYMTVDCQYLYDKHKSLAGDILMIEPIVEYEKFKICQKKISKNIRNILYYGLVSDKLEMSTFKYLLDKGVEIQIIGPKRDDIQIDKRIKYLGEVSHSELPKYIMETDALIIPYVDNEFMKGVIPAKIFECMASGKPLFVPNLYNFRKYSDMIYIYESNQDLYDIIRKFEYNNDVDKRNKRIDKAKNRDVSIFKKEIQNIIINNI